MDPDPSTKALVEATVSAAWSAARLPRSHLDSPVNTFVSRAWPVSGADRQARNSKDTAEDISSEDAAWRRGRLGAASPRGFGDSTVPTDFAWRNPESERVRSTGPHNPVPLKKPKGREGGEGIGLVSYR